MSTKREQRKGQVMLMTVLVMSAVFLSATVIAGLLMVYQLSQVTRVIDSARAIFAADSAVERGIFKILRCNTPSNFPPGWDATGNGDIDLQANKDLCDSLDASPSSADSFSNGASYTLSIYYQNLLKPDVNETEFSTSGSLKAVGIAGNSVRAVKFGPAP